MEPRPPLLAVLLLSSFLLVLADDASAQQIRADHQSAAVPSEIRTGVYRSQKVTYAVINGRNVYEGDILLDNVEPLMDPRQIKPYSITVAYAKYLWPKVAGVYQVPYIITNGTTNLNAALTEFNATFSGLIQFVPRASEADYVNFNFNSGDLSGVCDAFVGKIGGEQQVGGSASCAKATILHEMGHTIGLWHEQSRSDRDTYVNVLYNNIIKSTRSNFDQLQDNAQNVTLYDYASVMHYYPFAFSRNGAPTIESIPAGIPLSNTVGYTASDLDSIRRLYGATPSMITVTSNPPGLEVIVDGSTITTPQTFSWALNSAHTLAVSSNAQTLSGTTYIYGRWSDDPAASHSVTVSPGDGHVVQPSNAPAFTVYTANFIELVGFNPLINPPGAGTMAENPSPMTVNGATGTFYVVRQPVTFTATPNPGNNFYEWFSYMPGAVSANPKAVYMESQPPSIDVTAGFTPNAVTIITASPGDPSGIGVMVDGSFWYAPKNFSVFYDPTWNAGSTHTIAANSPQAPNSFYTRYDFNSWSDAGAQSHSINVPAGNSVFQANFTAQYGALESVPVSCGGSVAVAPPSPTGDGFYNSGTSVTFTESTNSGWTFAGWMDDLSGLTNPQNLTIHDETLVTANFNTAAVPLTLTSLTPASALAGGPGFTLTINGTGFTSGTIVFLNNLFRGGSTFVNSNQLTIPLSASDISAPGAFQVAVENFPNGAVCGAFGFKSFFVLASNMIGTSTAVISSVNPSAFAQLVTFTATVTPAKSGNPTGNVTFMDGNTTLGSGALNGSAQATFTTSSLAVGAHSITAVYAGDTSFWGSTSPTLAQTVNKAATTTTLASSKNPSSYKQSITLTATAKSSTSGTPTGMVTFKDGATTLGTGTLNSSGVATLAVSTLSVGAHTLTASYAGDANFTGSTSSTLAQTVNKAATTTTLASSKNPSSYKQSITLTATAKSSTSGTPTGTVTFKDGATTLGTGTLNSSGVATLAVSTLSVGAHTLTASYAGDANFTGSTSSTLTQTVNKAATTTTIASSKNPSVFGQSVTFTATVTSAMSGTATGTVTFKNGGTALGTGTLNSSGVATFSTTILSKGTHSITAVYAGDGNFTGSTSATLSQVVN